MDASESYTQVSDDGLELDPCPLCGSVAELWQRDYSRGPGTAKFVCCSNTDKLADVDGCPLSMPPEDFYRARKTEAVETWNEFSKVVKSMREAKA